MPRTFFKRFKTNRAGLQSRWYLRPFQRLLHHPRFFSVTRKSVVPAVAIGMFIAWLPVPGHFIYAALVALALRANVAIAAATTLIVNPLTFAPMYYCAYRVGRAILQSPAIAFRIEMSWQWLTHEFALIWQPLLLGGLVMGTATSAIAYVALDSLWRASTHAAWTQRIARRLSATDAD